MTGAATAGAIRCLVADDHPAVLWAVTDYLTAEGVAVVPQVAVVDLRMPDLTGTEVAREAATPAGSS